MEQAEDGDQAAGPGLKWGECLFVFPRCVCGWGGGGGYSERKGYNKKNEFHLLFLSFFFFD